MEFEVDKYEIQLLSQPEISGESHDKEEPEGCVKDLRKNLPFLLEKSTAQGVVQELLRSKLLIDENASFLGNLLLSDNGFLPLNRRLRESSLILGQASLSYYFYKSKSIPVLLSGVATATYFALKEGFNRKLIWTFKKLIGALKKLNFTVRKCLTFIKEQSISVTVSEKTIRGDPLVSQHLISKRRELLTSILRSFHESVTRQLRSTVSLMTQVGSLAPLTSAIDCPERYLGLTEGVRDRLKNSEADLTLAEVEANIQVQNVLQSELLERLTLSLFPEFWSSPLHLSSWDIYQLMTVMDTFTDSTNSSCDAIKRSYTLYQPLPQPDAHKSSCSLTLGVLASSVTSVAFSLRELEELSAFDKSAFNTQLERIENNLVESLKLLQCLKTRPEPKTTPPSSQLRTPIENRADVIPPTRIQVGYSDFTPRDVDRVYLIVTDQDNDNDVVADDNAYPPLKLPESVYTELKIALDSKKQEFTLRESQALTICPDLNKYMNFVEAQEEVKEVPEPPPSPPPSFNFHKNLAASAIQSALVRRTGVEDVFCMDSEESEDETHC